MWYLIVSIPDLCTLTYFKKYGEGGFEVTCRWSKTQSKRETYFENKTGTNAINFVTVKDEHKTVKLTSGTDENANIVQTSEDSMTHTEVKQNSDNIYTLEIPPPPPQPVKGKERLEFCNWRDAFVMLN